MRSKRDQSRNSHGRGTKRSASTLSNDRTESESREATQASRAAGVPPAAASTRRGPADIIGRASAGDATASIENFQEALRFEGAESSDDLSLYVHLPFCPSRCLSCDHQTSVSHDPAHIDRYLDDVEREIGLVTEHLGRGRRLQQLHLGGGTPNYLSEVQLVRLVDMLDRHFCIDDGTDSSLEANAHRASHAQLSLLHGLGFRSLSLELRDLDPRVQAALGRRQSMDVVRDVIESAREVGFHRVSTDIVYGLPQQTVTTIRETIQKLLFLEPDRISCYSFSRRPERFQHQHAVDSKQMPSLADKLAIFSRIVDGLCGADYEWVGLDCFARSDDRITQAQQAGTLQRNWIGYTDRTGRSLLGFGSSAVSDLPTIHARNQLTIEQWQHSLQHGQLPVEHCETMTTDDRRRRNALSDLMCNLRGDGTAFAVNDDGSRDSALQGLCENGLVELDGDRVSVTESGRYALHQLWGDASPSYRWGQPV